MLTLNASVFIANSLLLLSFYITLPFTAVVVFAVVRISDRELQIFQKADEVNL
jgi:hypothetical protein